MALHGGPIVIRDRGQSRDSRLYKSTMQSGQPCWMNGWRDRRVQSTRSIPTTILPPIWNLCNKFGKIEYPKMEDSGGRAGTNTGSNTPKKTIKTTENRRRRNVTSGARKSVSNHYHIQRHTKQKHLHKYKVNYNICTSKYITKWLEILPLAINARTI